MHMLPVDEEPILPNTPIPTTDEQPLAEDTSNMSDAEEMEEDNVGEIEGPKEDSSGKGE